jgi:hypothetical protein
VYGVFSDNRLKVDDFINAAIDSKKRGKLATKAAVILPFQSWQNHFVKVCIKEGVRKGCLALFETKFV